MEALKQALDSKYPPQNQIPRVHLGLVPPALEADGGDNVPTLQRKAHLCITFLGIERSQSQFPYSCAMCMSVIDLYIPRIGPHISCSRIGRSIMRI